MHKVQTDNLPTDWSQRNLAAKKDAVASAWDIPKDGYVLVSVGRLNNVILSRTGVSHTLKMHPSKEKDALLLNVSASMATLKNAYNEKKELPRKRHIDQVFRFDSKCLIDGKVLNVGIVVHHNKLDNRYYLYHVAVYGIKKAGH